MKSANFHLCLLFILISSCNDGVGVANFSNTALTGNGAISNDQPSDSNILQIPHSFSTGLLMWMLSPMMFLK